MVKDAPKIWIWFKAWRVRSWKRTPVGLKWCFFFKPPISRVQHPSFEEYPMWFHVYSFFYALAEVSKLAKVLERMAIGPETEGDHIETYSGLWHGTWNIWNNENSDGDEKVTSVGHCWIKASKPFECPLHWNCCTLNSIDFRNTKYSQKGPSIQRGGFRRKKTFWRTTHQTSIPCSSAWHTYIVSYNQNIRFTVGYLRHPQTATFPSDMPIRPNLGVHAKGLKDKRRTTVHILISARICTESSKLAFRNKKMIWLISLDESLLTTSSLPPLPMPLMFRNVSLNANDQEFVGVDHHQEAGCLATERDRSHVPWKCRKVVTTMPRCDKYSLPSWSLRSVLFGQYVDVKLLEAVSNTIWTIWRYQPCLDFFSHLHAEMWTYYIITARLVTVVGCFDERVDLTVYPLWTLPSGRKLSP